MIVVLFVIVCLHIPCIFVGYYIKKICTLWNTTRLIYYFSRLWRRDGIVVHCIFSFNQLFKTWIVSKVWKMEKKLKIIIVHRIKLCLKAEFHDIFVCPWYFRIQVILLNNLKLNVNIRKWFSRVSIFDTYTIPLSHNSEIYSLYLGYHFQGY